jgi:anti-sigma regulatory factor (Ser/Thr protein kinase)
MALVEVAFTPLPAHVRTARLVAVAVARRSGVADSLLDEVRLAVGEACSRAVEAHRQYCPAEPVKIALTDSGGRFEVVVTDAAPGDAAALDGLKQAGQAGNAAGAAGDVAAAGNPAGATSQPLFDAQGGLQDGSGLAVIAELADDVRISRTAAGISVCMSWPSSVRER